MGGLPKHENKQLACSLQGFKTSPNIKPTMKFRRHEEKTIERTHTRVHLRMFGGSDQIQKDPAAKYEGPLTKTPASLAGTLGAQPGRGASCVTPLLEKTSSSAFVPRRILAALPVYTVGPATLKVCIPGRERGHTRPGQEAYPGNFPDCGAYTQIHNIYIVPQFVRGL